MRLRVVDAVDVTTSACNPTISSPARLEACRRIKYQEDHAEGTIEPGRRRARITRASLSTGKRQRSPKDYAAD
jgi:hypothetical protein